jgi:hypothetical protein
MSNHLFVGIDISTSPRNVVVFLDSNGQRTNKALSLTLVRVIFSLLRSKKIYELSKTS